MNTLHRILAATMVVAVAIPASATVLFFDDFQSDTPGLNKPVLNNWTVIPTIDLIADPNGYGIVGKSGLSGEQYVDLDGSTANAGGLESIATFDLTLGQEYRLSFWASGNQRTNTSDTVDFGVGATFTDSLTLQSNDPWTLYSFDFVGDGSTGAKIFFDHYGGDNVGILLDDVKLEAVPEPATLAILGLGAAAVARRKRRQA